MIKNKFMFLLSLALIQLCFDMISSEKQNKNNKFTILLLGDVGSGRSCFINKFFKQRIAQVGAPQDDDTKIKYSAKTKEVTIYKRDFKYDANNVIKNVTVIDTPGFDLSSETNSFLSLFDIFVNLLVKNVETVDSIFLFFPLNLNSNEFSISENKLIKQIEMIKKFLGEPYSKIISDFLILIPSKRKRILPYQDKFLQEINKNYGIKYVHFKSDREEEMGEDLVSQLYEYIIKKEVLKKIYVKTLRKKINCFYENKMKYSECLNIKYSDLDKIQETLLALFNNLKEKLLNKNPSLIAATALLIIIPIFFVVLDKINRKTKINKDDFIKTVKEEKEEEKTKLLLFDTVEEVSNPYPNDIEEIEACEYENFQIADPLEKIENDYEIIN